MAVACARQGRQGRRGAVALQRQLMRQGLGCAREYSTGRASELAGWLARLISGHLGCFVSAGWTSSQRY
eukprot:3430738-Pleurochrysis_carterae.AAC.2